jgi:hypothetical protein
MHRRRRAMRLLPIALMALFAPLSLAAQEVALDVTASEMAQPIDAARMLPGATPAAFPLPRPATLRSATAAPEMSLRPVERDPWAAPRLRWDGHSQDMDWTLATMAALRGPGASLVRTVPQDIADWCPGYEAAGTGQRRAFWAGLVSALAWHESTHDAGAVGGGGRNGSGWCRSRRRRRGIGAARRPRARRSWTGRRTCAAVSGSWGQRCRATAWSRGGCAAWRPIGARSIRRGSARTCGNG